MGCCTESQSNVRYIENEDHFRDKSALELRTELLCNSENISAENNSYDSYESN